MLQLADRYTVPQIFFNERHIGGRDNLEALEAAGELAALHSDMEMAAADPTDPRLAPPTYPPLEPPPPPSRAGGPAEEPPDPGLFSPNTLNSWREWKGEAQAAVPCVLRLRKQLSTIISAHTEASTGLVDYRKTGESEQFGTFHIDSCELQAVDYLGLSTEERLCFCIELYNMMLQHAYAQRGVVSDIEDERRERFFGNVGYDIQGQKITLRELEHGVLRANALRPGRHWPDEDGRHSVPDHPDPSPCFPEGDARLAYVVPLDGRVHFALNCGALSCPPVLAYSPEAVDAELQIAAIAFCEQETNVRVDIEARTLWLSTIFLDYQEDFGGSERGIADSVCGWLRGYRRVALEKLLAGDAALSLKRLPYNWGNNASDSFEFVLERPAVSTEANM